MTDNFIDPLSPLETEPTYEPNYDKKRLSILTGLVVFAILISGSASLLVNRRVTTSNQAAGKYITTNCADGTPNNQCSTQKPKYCSSGTLVNKCSLCGCPGGMVCGVNNGCSLPQPTPTPIEPAGGGGGYHPPKTSPTATPAPRCSDGTPGGQCSSQRPLYCSQSGISFTLVSKCSQCGCPVNTVCSGSGSCVSSVPTSIPTNPPQPTYIPQPTATPTNKPQPTAIPQPTATPTRAITPTPAVRCSDGTLNYQCSTNKPLYCNGGALINNCVLCGCPSTYYCNYSNQNCYQ